MQVGKTSSIGRTINIGSQASPTATAKAQNVALGKQRGSGVSYMQSSSNANYVRPPRSIHPGSSAGYKHFKSAHIQSENSGYLNPSLQKARYTRKELPIPKLSNMLKYGNERNRVFDRRIAKSLTSASKRLMKLT